jgi:hypothetical protein
MWTRRPVAGRSAGWCGLQVAPAEFVALDEENVGAPTSRGNLLDTLVEDEVPITRGLQLLNSTPPLRGRCQTRCYKTRSQHAVAGKRGMMLD